MFLNYVGRSDDALLAWEKAGQLGLEDPIVSAQLALRRGDHEALENQLRLIMLKFGEKSAAYMIFKAWFLFVSGDQVMASEIMASVRESPSDYDAMTNAWSAYFQRDLELFVEYYARALEANEIRAWMGVSNVPADIKEHPGFEEMLKKFHLDKKSVEKLEFPALPI